MSRSSAPAPMDPCSKCTPGARPHLPGRCTGHVDEEDGTVRPCRRWPTRGATVCTSHGAAAPQVKAAARRNVALAKAMTELDKLGGFVELEPADAMLGMVHEAAWNVALYRHLVQRLRVNDVDAGTGVLEGTTEDGPWIDDIDRSELGASIASRVDPGNWKAAPHIWVAMYDAERERLMRWSKACRDAGVDERQVALAEADGRRIVAMLLAGFDALFALLEGDVAGDRLAELRRDQLPDIVRKAIETTAVEGA